MNKLKILIWDDLCHEAEKMRDHLSPIIMVNGWDMDVDINCKPYTDFFNSVLQKKHTEYDLLILDCIEGADNEIASQALKALKKLNSTIKVIVTSSFQPRNFETLPSHYHENLCKAILKTPFQSNNDPNRAEVVISEMMGIEANQWYLTKKINLIYSIKNINLICLIESIGGDKVLRQIVLQIISLFKIDIEQNKFEIHAITQGKSGAVVFKLIITDNVGNTNSLLLKVSNSKEALIKELNKSKNEYTNILSKYRIQYKFDKPITLNEKLFFIISEYIDDSVTLKNIIIEDKLNLRSITLIEKLMLSCMSPLYLKRRITSAISQISSDIIQIFDIKRFSYLLMACHDLDILIKDFNIEKEFFSYEEFIEQSKIFYVKDNLKRTIIHGDFHGNNILVDTNNDIIILDPPEMNFERHWAEDICLLIADLFAYGIDYNNKEFFGIKKINEWIETGKSLINGVKLKSNLTNKGLIESLIWLVDEVNLKKIFNRYYEKWEFHLSLSMSFLRLSYKQDQLPPGKRAACLLIGIEAFKLAKKSFDDSKKE